MQAIFITLIISIASIALLAIIFGVTVEVPPRASSVVVQVGGGLFKRFIKKEKGDSSK